MKIRRRPFVRTLVVGSVLAFTGCNQDTEASATDASSPDGDTDIGEPEVTTNPWFDVDAGDGWDIDVPEVEPDVDYDWGMIIDNPWCDWGNGDADAEVAPEVAAPDAVADAETTAVDADAETASSDADVLLPPGNPIPDA
jgi:hypothetical protein